ncbi:MAG: hypothetical protein K8R53_03310 [Bacteroidales bacterium]|nr:hypothetical protein [Bacteroidales bacterium]
MKSHIVYSILIFVCFLFTISVKGQESGPGIGIVVGEPTGVAFKQWIGKTNAVDAALAWSFVNNSSLYLHADYLWHNFNLIEIEEGSFPIYWGVGGRIKFTKHTRVGVQVPLGISYIFDSTPLDVFLEIRPTLDLIPGTDFTVSGGIGVRYYLD